MINYNIKIDPKKEKTYYSDIEFTTGDVRAYKFTFEFIGINTKGCTLCIKAKRADGNVVIAKANSCSEFAIPNNMYSVAGEVYFEIAVYDASGGCITTKVISATVRDGFGEEGIISDDRYPILTSLINEVNALSTSVKTLIDETGDISAALDSIITIQESLIGGEAA